MNETKIIIDNIISTPYVDYKLDHFRNWNKECRDIYKNNIEINLRIMYDNYLNEKNLIVNLPGEDEHHSFLNFLNTNETCVSLIVNYFNHRIIKCAHHGYLCFDKVLNFSNDPSLWREEMMNLITLISKYHEEVFAPTSELYFELKKQIQKTKSKGNYSEKKIIGFLLELFPDATNIKQGGDGINSDMYNGIDIQFEHENKMYTVQNKSCKLIRETYLAYIIDGASGMKDYHTDLITFIDKTGCMYVFKNNENVKLVKNTISNTYTISKENLIAKKF